MAPASERRRCTRVEDIQGPFSGSAAGTIGSGTSHTADEIRQEPERRGLPPPTIEAGRDFVKQTFKKLGPEVFGGYIRELEPDQIAHMIPALDERQLRALRGAVGLRLDTAIREQIDSVLVERGLEPRTVREISPVLPGMASSEARAVLSRLNDAQFHKLSSLMNRDHGFTEKDIALFHEVAEQRGVELGSVDDIARMLRGMSEQDAAAKLKRVAIDRLRALDEGDDITQRDRGLIRAELERRELLNS